MKVSSQHYKDEDFYTHYLIGGSAYVLISRHFIESLSSEKIIILQILLVCLLTDFLITYNWNTPKVIVPHVSKRTVFVKVVLAFLGSTQFQIGEKLHKLLTNKLTSYNLKVTWPFIVKHFSLSRVNYLRCYCYDLFLSQSVVVVVLLIMVRPNVISKSEFVNIKASHISLEKRWRLTTTNNSDLRTPPMLKLFSILHLAKKLF